MHSAVAHCHSPFLHLLSRVSVPALPITTKMHLPPAVAHLSYKAVLAWGLVGIYRNAERPQHVSVFV